MAAGGGKTVIGYAIVPEDYAALVDARDRLLDRGDHDIGYMMSLILARAHALVLDRDYVPPLRETGDGDAG